MKHNNRYKLNRKMNKYNKKKNKYNKQKNKLNKKKNINLIRQCCNNSLQPIQQLKMVK